MFISSRDKDQRKIALLRLLSLSMDGPINWSCLTFCSQGRCRRDTPPRRRLLQRTVRILLEWILDFKVYLHWEKANVKVNFDLCCYSLWPWTWILCQSTFINITCNFVINFYDSSISAGLRVGEASGGYPAPEGGGGTAQVTVTEGRWVTWQYQLTVGQIQQAHDWDRFYAIVRYVKGSFISVEKFVFALI